MKARLAGFAMCLPALGLALAVLPAADRQRGATAEPQDTNDPADPILETCSETDRFTFTDIGTVMDANKMGVEVGSSIADSTAVVLPDGRVRMYFQYLAKDWSRGAHYSAISSDGVTFTMESGARMGDNEWRDPWWGPHVKAKWLSDGRLRIYKGATPASEANTGIISYISSDGLTLTKEEGFRITPGAAGLKKLSHLTIVSTLDGRYRGYFSNMPEGTDSTRLVKSAVSSDLLTWTMDSGVRVGTGASVTAIADYSAEQLHALQRGSGCVTLFYFNTHYQNSFLRTPDLRYSTSRDGVTFTTGYSLGLNGNGPDIVKLSDGTHLLYYDVGGEKDGFAIRVAKLELVRPFSRGASSIDSNGDGAADVFLYNVSSGATSLELSDRAGGFNRRLDTWERGRQVLPGDLDGDGVADFLLYDPTSGVWVQAIGKPGGTFTYTTGTWDKDWQVVPADLDGDRRTDAFLYNFTTGLWMKCFSDGSAEYSCLSGTWDPGWELYRADMSGEGRDDFFLYNRTTGSWMQALSPRRRTDAFDTLVTGKWDPDWMIHPADLNGDRRVDLFLLASTGAHRSALSRVAGDFDLVTGSQWDAGWSVYPGDFDGDRKTDLFLYNAATGNWMEAFSDGSGSFSYTTGRWDPSWDVYATDLNGDGRDDLLLYGRDGIWVQALTTGRGSFSSTQGTWGKGWTVFTRR